MDSEIHEYWQRRMTEAINTRDDLCAELREEVSRLQNRCNELATINSMGRASVAMDIREFAVTNAVPLPNGTPVLPLATLVDFLHMYSNGLVPQLPRESKRQRAPDAVFQNYNEQPQSYSARNPVTPTIAQLIAARNATPAIAGPPAPASMAVAPVASPETLRNEFPSACRVQQWNNRSNETVDPRKRNDRGPSMEDEAVQTRPWLFSRAP